MCKKIHISKEVLDDLLNVKKFSVKRISEIIGTSRSVVKKRAIEYGFTVPNMRDGVQRAYNHGFTPNVYMAHKSRRGSQNSFEHQKKIAEFYSGTIRSKYELIMYEALKAKGLSPFPNLAVGRYNIDIAFQDVLLAIEVDGGNWHNSPKKRELDHKKSKYLSSLGWNIIRFPFCKRDGFNIDSYVNEVIRVLNKLSENP
jgi:very-short-patch-repair endonuclease